MPGVGIGTITSLLTDGLRSFILAQPAIAAIVADRVQPIPAPEDLSRPIIVYSSPSDKSENANDGPVGVATTRVVFDCYAPQYRDARALALMLKALFNGYAGTLPDGNVVQLATSESLADRFDDGSRISCTTFQTLITYGD
jgi:hypothetical protein